MSSQRTTGIYIYIQQPFFAIKIVLINLLFLIVLKEARPKYNHWCNPVSSDLLNNINVFL